MTTDRLIRIGCWAAGLANIVGISVVSHFFTNDLLATNFPAVFSQAGNFLILLWGCAYIVAGLAAWQVPLMFLVFMVEKYFYAGTWLYWYLQHGDRLAAITAESWLTGTFYRFYGLNDLLWGLFFLWVFTRVRRGSPAG